MADDLERFERALRWWSIRGEASPTSSLTGGGAIAELEALLGLWFGGHTLALPSGSSAIRTGLRVLGIEPGKTVALAGTNWFGAAGVVESTGGSVAMAHEPADVVLMGADDLANTVTDGGCPWLVDGANLPPGGYARLSSHRWAALALSFGPGKPVDAGEGGALIVRDFALHANAVRLTQHPLRQQLTGLLDPSVRGACERIHPVAALTVLYELRHRSVST